MIECDTFHQNFKISLTDNERDMIVEALELAEAEGIMTKSNKNFALVLSIYGKLKYRPL